MKNRELELTQALSQAQEQIRNLESAKEENQWLEGAIRRRTAILNERVKELDCLYALSDLFSKPLDAESLIRKVALLLPDAWRYPNSTNAHIHLNHRDYKTPGFVASHWILKESIAIEGKTAGFIEIHSMGPFISEDPFLKEEKNLLRVVAVWLGHVLALRLNLN